MIRAVDGPLGAVAGNAPEDTEYRGAAARLRDTWVALRASERQVLEVTTLADIAHDTLPDSVAALIAADDAWIRRLEHVVQELAVGADPVHPDALEQPLRRDVRSASCRPGRT